MLAACAAVVVAAIAADAAPLKFMTFNIWGDYFGNPVCEREAGVEATILKEMPDVVSLQEVTPNADVRSPHCSHHGNPKRGEDGKYHGSLRPAKDDTPDRSIDHIYYTRGIHALRHEIVTDQTALDASDHSPVIVEFELR